MCSERPTTQPFLGQWLVSLFYEPSVGGKAPGQSKPTPHSLLPSRPAIGPLTSQTLPVLCNQDSLLNLHDAPQRHLSESVRQASQTEAIRTQPYSYCFPSSLSASATQLLRKCEPLRLCIPGCTLLIMPKASPPSRLGLAWPSWPCFCSTHTAHRASTTRQTCVRVSSLRLLSLRLRVI